MTEKPLLIVLSGDEEIASQVAKELTKAPYNMRRSIPWTTGDELKMREKNADAEYVYITTNHFQNEILDDTFLEWELADSCVYYGTPWRPVRESLGSNKHIVVTMSVERVKNLRSDIYDSSQINFMIEPRRELLRDSYIDIYLAPRSFEDDKHSLSDMQLLRHLIVDSDIEYIAKTISQIIEAEKLIPESRLLFYGKKVSPRII